MQEGQKFDDCVSTGDAKWCKLDSLLPASRQGVWEASASGQDDMGRTRFRLALEAPLARRLTRNAGRRRQPSLSIHRGSVLAGVRPSRMSVLISSRVSRGCHLISSYFLSRVSDLAVVPREKKGDIARIYTCKRAARTCDICRYALCPCFSFTSHCVDGLSAPK
jgi:hypothetical protein